MLANVPAQVGQSAREYGELWREKCTRAPWTFPLARNSSFRPARPDKWKTTGLKRGHKYMSLCFNIF